VSALGRVAVTGAGGFLGQRVVARLLADGIDVLPLVRDPARAALPVPAVAWQIGDAPPLADVQTVIHAAAHRPARYGDPAEAATCLRVNAEGTVALVEAAARAGVVRFVYVSSGHVYRDLGPPSREGDAIAPSHHAPYYLASKICGEWFVGAAHGAGRISAVTVRPSAIYGSGMPPGLVATFASKLSAGAQVTVADGGRYAADLVYVDDVAAAIVAAAACGGPGAYNVGGGAPITTLELAHTLARLIGASEEQIRVDPQVAGRPGPAGLALDITRARAELDYSPRPLEEGLRAMLAARRRE
jgi:UDP-glucose 4-epimerase